MKVSPPQTSPDKVPPYVLNKMFTANLFASAYKQNSDEKNTGITPEMKKGLMQTP